MNENKIIETLKYISQFIENRHDEDLGDYLHIVIGRTDINVIDETIYLLERKQKEIVRYKKEIEEKSTIIMAGAEKVKQLEKEIEELKSIASEFTNRNIEQFSIGEFNFKVKHFKDNYIHKDKIRELKEKVEKEMISNPYDFSYMINELLEEN